MVGTWMADRLGISSPHESHSSLDGRRPLPLWDANFKLTAISNKCHFDSDWLALRILHMLYYELYYYYYRHRAGLTFVRMMGVVRSRDSTQTSRIALLQLLIVHSDRDFIGNTITMNL
jgi:hypothetical protein